MKFWLPYTIGDSGSDVSINQLASALQKLGHTAIAEGFAHNYQYCPWLLSGKKPPVDTNCIIGNSWNAFAFAKPGIPLLTVERLFVLSKDYSAYKSFSQDIFHRFIIARWLKSSYQRSSAVIALSKDTAANIELVFDWVKPTVIMNAVDTEFFSPTATDAARNAELPLKMLYVGNLSTRKGTDLLPRILDKLGGKVHLEYTQDRDQSKFIDHANAECIGRLDLEGVRAAYRKADILILPTRLEGLPRAAMESISCGTPVISSDASSLPELVIDGVSGYTCAKDNVDEFVEKISRIADAPDLLPALSKSARRYAVDNLDLNKMAKRYTELAENLAMNP